MKNNDTPEHTTKALYKKTTKIKEKLKQKSTDVYLKNIQQSKIALQRYIQESKVQDGPKIHNTKFEKPVKNGIITSPYGYRIHPTCKRKIFHNGIDIDVKTGTPIYAPKDGVVKMAEWKNGYGNYIEITHKDENGKTISTFYGHLKSFTTSDGSKLKQGQIVKQGQQIGLSGNTGDSAGPHLHFGVKSNGNTKNPIDYIGNVYKRR